MNDVTGIQFSAPGTVESMLMAFMMKCRRGFDNNYTIEEVLPVFEGSPKMARVLLSCSEGIRQAAGTPEVAETILDHVIAAGCYAFEHPTLPDESVVRQWMEVPRNMASSLLMARILTQWAEKGSVDRDTIAAQTKALKEGADPLTVAEEMFK